MVEFLSIGYHAVRRAALTGGERVLVVGAGPIGMAVALFANFPGVIEHWMSPDAGVIKAIAEV